MPNDQIRVTWAEAAEDLAAVGVVAHTAETEAEFTFLNLGGFPGLLEGGDTAIEGEVYEVTDACLVRLDRLEGTNPSNPAHGLYRRLNITLANGQEVMTYCFNQNRGGCGTIDSGSWRKHVAEGKGRSYCG